MMGRPRGQSRVRNRRRDILSIPQWRILENARLESAGEEPQYFPRNRSQAGAWTGARIALLRRGYLNGDDQITPAGLKALKELAP